MTMGISPVSLCDYRQFAREEEQRRALADLLNGWGGTAWREKKNCTELPMRVVEFGPDRRIRITVAAGSRDVAVRGSGAGVVPGGCMAPGRAPSQQGT
ncbi:hypothetical protein ACIQCG_39040 [Streptomyces noursei]|uniref:hypothetical protein n=1 Tax=Streptomyces noursei TaxID=1971 RepID=UPI003802DD00